MCEGALKQGRRGDCCGENDTDDATKCALFVINLRINKEKSSKLTPCTQTCCPEAEGKCAFQWLI